MMNLKAFFTINAVMFIPFGIGMLIVPSNIFNMLDVILDNDGLLMASMVGSMLLSFGLVCLLARNFEGQSVALQAILIGNLTFHVIDSVLTFKGAFTGEMNNLAYAFSTMHLLIAIGFFFFYLKSKPVKAASINQS